MYKCYFRTRLDVVGLAQSA